MKRILKYTLMILAIGVVGLSVQAWAQPEAVEAANAVAETVPMTELIPATELATASAEVMPEDINLGESLMNFVDQSGISGIVNDWRVLVMLIISCVLLYLAIVKQFEPLLLLPIAFGMLLTNLPGAGMYHSELFADGHVHWTNAEGVAL